MEGDCLIQLDVSDDSRVVDILNGQMIVNLETEREKGDQIYMKGSLVSIDYELLIKGITN